MAHKIARMANCVDGFEWASVIDYPKSKYAKVCICGESFWVREIRKGFGGMFIGIVDNDLIGTESHGFVLNDKIRFVIPEENDDFQL